MHALEQLTAQDDWHEPLQRLEHPPTQVDEQFLEQVLHPDELDPPLLPPYGSSISHEVSNEGTAIAAIIGKAAVAAFLKNVLRLYFFSSIILDIKSKDRF